MEQVFTDYLTDVVGRHRDDDRVYLWDLCNEPSWAATSTTKQAPSGRLSCAGSAGAETFCRAVGAIQPLTVGNYTYATAVALTEPLSDVISFHPYYIWNLDPAEQTMAAKREFEHHLDTCSAIAAAAGKDLLATETVCGARDDTTHVEVMRYTLGELVKRDIGFTVHALHHRRVSDLHRDAYGPVGPPECLHFIEADGRLRAGHDALTSSPPPPATKERSLSSQNMRVDASLTGVHLRLHHADQAAAYREGVLRVWNQAFAAVEDEHEWTTTVWERHRVRSDYRSATAHLDESLVVFAWGYTGERHRYWPHSVLRATPWCTTDGGCRSVSRRTRIQRRVPRHYDSSARRHRLLPRTGLQEVGQETRPEWD